MNDTLSRSDCAVPLSDDHGKVVGYFFPARVYERWQTRCADLNRQLAGAPREQMPVPADVAAAGPAGPLPFNEVLDMLKAIGDADRLRLLLELKAGPRNVGALAQAIGTEIVNASHHLSVLRNARLCSAKNRAVRQLPTEPGSLGGGVITLCTKVISHTRTAISCRAAVRTVSGYCRARRRSAAAPPSDEM